MIIQISWPQPTEGNCCLPGKDFYQFLSDRLPLLPVRWQYVGGSTSAVSEAILVTGMLMLTAFPERWCGRVGNQWRLLMFIQTYIFIHTHTSCS